MQLEHLKQSYTNWKDKKNKINKVKKLCNSTLNKQKYQKQKSMKLERFKQQFNKKII